MRKTRRVAAVAVMAALLGAPFLTSAKPGHAATSRWTLVPTRTAVTFSVDAIGWPKTEGRFRDFSGDIEIDLDHPSASRIRFSVRTASLDVGSSMLTGYIRSSSFLDTDRHPEARFVSTSVEKVGENEVRMTGEFTLLGVTKPMVADVTVSPRDGVKSRLEFVVRTQLHRSEYGMNAGQPIISDIVAIEVASEAMAR